MDSETEEFQELSDQKYEDEERLLRESESSHSEYSPCGDSDSTESGIDVNQNKRMRDENSLQETDSQPKAKQTKISKSKIGKYFIKFRTKKQTVVLDCHRIAV